MEFSLPQGADYFLSLPKKCCICLTTKWYWWKKIVVFFLDGNYWLIIWSQGRWWNQDLLHMVMMRSELVYHLAMVILWCASFHGNEEMTSIKSSLSIKRWINVMTSFNYNLAEKKKDRWSVVFWSELPLGFLGSYDMQYHASFTSL